ncbi:MAG: VIT domain-containing protein [Planctomycetota bacterium]
MAEWTQSATDALNQYFENIRANLESSGADPNEVKDDIKRHIEKEIDALNLSVVTEDDLRRILSRVGAPEISGVGAQNSRPETSKWQSKAGAVFKFTAKRVPKVFVLLFGVLLPFLTLGIEYGTHMCAGTFFDPIPTIWHVFLVGLVPVTNLIIWMYAWREKSPRLSTLGLVNGIAIGTSFFYTILFLPLVPMSVIAIMFMGMGLLSLTPILSFVATILSRRLLKQISSTVAPQGIPGLWWGICISIGLLMLFEMPKTLTRLGMEMAASEFEGTSLRGIRTLRNIGNEQIMLKMCYERPGMATDIIGFLFSVGNPVSPEKAREIHYRVTGIPFNTVSPPKLTLGRGRYDPWEDFVFDEGIGGDEVAGRVKDLSLASSRMDGSVDPDAALAYLEWTLVFENSSWQQREARALVALPPGGVVSRLTLWIDGQEREAAFAARGKVKEAYKEVVRRSRDPVLVTTRGPDRVFVQCFPVPPNGKMKVRVGITSPLFLESFEQGVMMLPCCLERNFSIPESVGHDIWIESKKPIVAQKDCLKSENPKKELFAMRGKMSNSLLVENRAVIRTGRTKEALEAWTRDPLAENERVVRQTIRKKNLPAPSRVVFVIDGSRGMRERINEIAEALLRFPVGVDFGILVASDAVLELTQQVQVANPQTLSAAANQLKIVTCRGGCDNIPTLSKAWDLAAERPDSAIVWIHGAHPVILQTTEPLRQKWERRPDNPRLYDVQVVSGSNKVMENLEDIRVVEAIPRTGTLARDLEKLFSEWSGNSKRLEYVREMVSKDVMKSQANSKETSSHLARLWANDRIWHLSSTKDPRKIDEAIGLAASYQIVTPVSGAVVLENPSQYAQTGLQPVDPNTVPTIPEPETWALIAVVVCILAWLFCRRRRACGAA